MPIDITEISYTLPELLMVMIPVSNGTCYKQKRYMVRY